MGLVGRLVVIEMRVVLCVTLGSAVVGGCIADREPLLVGEGDGGELGLDSGSVVDDGGESRADAGTRPLCALEFDELPAFETIEGLHRFAVVHRTQLDCLRFSMLMEVKAPGWLAQWHLQICSACPDTTTLHTFGTTGAIEEVRGFEDAVGTTYLECPRAFDPTICTRAERCDLPQEPPRVPSSRSIEVKPGRRVHLDVGIFNEHGFVTYGDWRTSDYLDRPELRECHAWEVAPELPDVSADIAGPLRLVYGLPSLSRAAPRAPAACLTFGFGVPASCGWPLINDGVVGDIVRSPAFELPPYVPDLRQ